MMNMLLFLACAGVQTPAVPETPAPTASEEAQAFLDGWVALYQPLMLAAGEAEWTANTHIVPGDDAAIQAVTNAMAALSNHTGSVETITTTRALLEKKDELEPIQVLQLEQILRGAAMGAQTNPELTTARIEAEAKQTEALYGYEFSLNGEPITPNDIDSKLVESTDLAERQAVWEASKDIGPSLKPGLVELRDLRNEQVRELGYPDFFSYQVDGYGLEAQEMMVMMDRLNQEMRPLYRELHTWARYELAERYGQEVPEQLPAHWLPNRWGQSWAPLVSVEGADMEAAFADKSPEWIVKESEAFYVSLGFDPLPQSFWDKSSLYPVPEGADYKKNTHASAWHMDLDKDVRCLMSVEPNEQWYGTTEHELGHIYYYMSYSRPEVPLLLRGGANRAYHEAVGTMMGMAATQAPFLEARGLLPEGAAPDPTQLLLREALDMIVFIPFAAGTMSNFEHQLYADELSPDEFNKAWWELAYTYQGIVPPTERGEEFADALTKTHINDDPAQYYDYALSNIILFQLHDHIASEILQQDPRATNYFGNKEVGDFLKSVLEPGATRDWNELLVESTGSELTAEPMLEYYAPLMEWLQKENEGRVHTLPELPTR